MGRRERFKANLRLLLKPRFKTWKAASDALGVDHAWLRRLVTQGLDHADHRTVDALEAMCRGLGLKSVGTLWEERPVVVPRDRKTPEERSREIETRLARIVQWPSLERIENVLSSLSGAHRGDISKVDDDAVVLLLIKQLRLDLTKKRFGRMMELTRRDEPVAKGEVQPVSPPRPPITVVVSPETAAPQSMLKSRLAAHAQRSVIQPPRPSTVPKAPGAEPVPEDTAPPIEEPVSNQESSIPKSSTADSSAPGEGASQVKDNPLIRDMAENRRRDEAAARSPGESSFTTSKPPTTLKSKVVRPVGQQGRNPNRPVREMFTLQRGSREKARPEEATVCVNPDCLRPMPQIDAESCQECGRALCGECWAESDYCIECSPDKIENINDFGEMERRGFSGLS